MLRNLKRMTVIGLSCMLVMPALVGGASAPAAAKSKKGAFDFVDLKKVPKPKISGGQIIKGLEELVEKYPLRQSILRDTPVGSNIQVSDFLAEEARKNGFKTRVIEYEGAGQAGKTIRVVEAVKEGTEKPDEWIAFIAHYDTVASAGFTIQGAYDDGTGTNMLRYFGKAFSKIKTKRSIALLWFDAEETGLTASQKYVSELPKNVEIHAAMGFDMVGIGYPARYCICVYHGPVDAPLAMPILDYVNFDFLEFPEGDGGPGASQKWPMGTEPHVCSCGPNIRNSDESNFAEAGFFSLRWTGMRTASDYPGYHQPWDTVEFMEQVAGSRENLEQGTENTFNSAYYTTFVLDNLP